MDYIYKYIYALNNNSERKYMGGFWGRKYKGELLLVEYYLKIRNNNHGPKVLEM